MFCERLKADQNFDKSPCEMNCSAAEDSNIVESINSSTENNALLKMNDKERWNIFSFQ